MSAQSIKATVYLFPGQGSDSMIFSNWTWDTTQYKIVHIHYHTPNKGQTMAEYAQELMPQIENEGKYFFVGVSLGGMLSVELADTLNPSKTIIISSAQNRSELPSRYRFMRNFRLYNAISAKRYKKSSIRTQKIVEPDRANDAELFSAMLNRKDSLFLKRATHMIVQWSRKQTPENVVNIHGDNDHTIPIKNVTAAYTIEGGSHMMAHTRSEEVFSIVQKELLGLTVND